MSSVTAAGYIHSRRCRMLAGHVGLNQAMMLDLYVILRWPEGV